MSLKEPKFGDVFRWVNSRHSDPVVMYIGPSIEEEWGAHPGWYGVMLAGYDLDCSPGDTANWAKLDDPLGDKHWEPVE